MPAQPQPKPRSPVPWRAQWCWTRKHLVWPWNTYASFRRTVELPDKPRSAVVRVSADARYTLYVNGQRVHQGPARSFPQTQSFDSLDIASYLQAGPNAICATVHQFGVPTFQSVYRDASGFLLDGVIEVADRSLDVSTPEGWMCRESRAWRKDVSRLSVQLGFQEHFDADADDPQWLAPDAKLAAEQGWAAPFTIGPVGTHPWIRMEPRGVPLLSDGIVSFHSVVGQFGGENARGYKIAPDVYHLLAGETRRKDKGLIEQPLAMLRDDGEATIVPAPEDGHFAMVVLDLGQERTGHIQLDIAEAAGDEIIDIIYTEAVESSGEPMLIPAASICQEATADRYRCRPGAQRWEPFFMKGFRYATLVFRNVAKPLKIRYISLREVRSALDEAGTFECSDERLNRIWQVGRQTLRNCMFDAYVDCPWREQAQWWGDVRVQFLANLYAFGDLSLLERGIRQVAQSQAADGSLHAHPPADLPGHRLPDYMMTWVGTLWDHYFHSGRTDLLRECLPTMHRLFEFFAAHEVVDGLVGNFEGWWVFLDWQNLRKTNFSAVLNLMYLQALRWAAAICQILEEEAAAARYSAKADALADALPRYFWDAKAKLWRDGWDPATSAPVEAISQHANALAILLGLKPETSAAIAKDVLVKSSNSKRSKILTASPFFYAYVLDALAEARARDQIVPIIREKWGRMIDEGATTFWELWEVGPQSRCHAWSASPLYHLPQTVLGVRPVEAGWSLVRIAPAPAGLDFARGIVPSPRGPIRVEWEKVEEDQLAIRVELPPGVTGEFVSPLGEIRTLKPGSHEFHT